MAPDDSGNEDVTEHPFTEESLRELLRQEAEEKARREQELRLKVETLANEVLPSQEQDQTTCRQLVQEYFAPGVRLSGMVEPSDHEVVTFKKKFADIIQKRYDKTVVSWPDKLPQEDAEYPPWLRRLCKRHEEKRQRAKLLLSDKGFVKDLFATAKRWALDIHLFKIDPLDVFWSEPYIPALVVWEQFLRNASGKCWFDDLERMREAHRRLAEKYVNDLNIAPLIYGINESKARLPITRFEKEVQSFTRRHGLSALWEKSIVLLLLGGQFYVPYEDCRIVLQSDRIGDRLFFEIFPETRKQDLMDKWAHDKWLIEMLFPGRPKRRKIRPQFERDLSTRLARGEGRTIENIVVHDYDLDAQADEFASIYAIGKAEDLLAERLRTGVKRLRRAQVESESASADPTSEWQLDRHARMRGNWAREWHF